MGLLAAGAGAAEGLDTYLQRMLEQAKLDALTKGQTETAHHNMATEGILSREHDLKAEEQANNLKERAQAHTDIRNDRAQDNGRALGDELPAGTALNAGNDVELNHGNQDPAVGQMMQGGVGSLLKMRQASPAVPENIAAPGDNGEEQPKSYIKLKSAKQQHDDQMASKTGDYNVEEKTELVDGKPTPVLFDPRATNKAGGKGRYSLPGTGEDVSDKVQHYEKQPAPDRVIVQTGDSYDTRTNVRDRINKGESVPLATTGSTRTMEEGARMLQPHIKRLEQTAATLDQQGLFGPVMSRVRTLMTKAGTLGDFQTAIANDPELNKDRVAGQFATSLGLLATGAGRVHGGARGGGSPQMYQHFKEMLSDAGSLNMFIGRLDSLDEYMGGYAAGPGGHTPAAAPASGGNEIEYDLSGNVIKKKP